MTFSITMCLTLIHRSNSWDFDLENYDFPDVDYFFPDTGLSDFGFDFPDVIELPDSIIPYNALQDTEMQDIDMFIEEQLMSPPTDICYGAVSLEFFMLSSQHSFSYFQLLPLPCPFCV